jgi:hypothetical protein
MEILFTKTGKENDVLSCKRENGTVTWKHISSFFILHDIGHYVVEKNLLFRDAFFGMIAAGTAISDFDLPADQRIFQLTEEAIFTEHLVNLVVIEYTQGSISDLPGVLAAINDKRITPGLLKLVTDKKMEQIRNEYNDLLTKWSLLPDGQSLRFLFEE